MQYRTLISRNILCFLLLLLSCKIGFAQSSLFPAHLHHYKRPVLYIAEDFVNCGTGLKDSTGKWVVEPVYSHIDLLFNNDFIVSQGGMLGILDQNGTLIIPLLYANIEIKTCGEQPVFLVKNTVKQYGVLDTAGRMIVPVQFSNVVFYNNGCMGVFRKGQQWTFYTVDGKSFAVPVKMAFVPTAKDDSIFEFIKTPFGLGWWWLPEKHGLMDLQGHLLFPCKYFDVDYSHAQYNLVRLIKRKEVIYTTLDGREVFRGEKDIYNSESSNRENHPGTELIVNSRGYVPLKIKGKWGIMGANGDTVLPFVYKNIYKNGSYYAHAEQDLYFLSTDTSTGIYNATTRTWIAEPVYKKLEQIAGYLNSKDSSLVVLLLAQKGNYYGVITSAGQEILPFEFTDFQKNETSTWIFFGPHPLIMSLPEDSRFNPFYSFSNNYRSDRDYRAVTTVPSGNLFTLRNFQGDIRIFYNSELVNDSLQKTLYQVKNDEKISNPVNYDSLLHATAIVIRPFTKSLACDKNTAIYSYGSCDLEIFPSGSDSSYFYSPAGDPGKELYKTQLLINDSFYRYFKYVRTNTIDRYHRVQPRYGLVRSDGKELVRPGSLSRISTSGMYNGLARFDITAWRYEHQGIIDGNGQLLADTVWTNVASTQENYALVKKYYWPFRYTEKDNLLDLRTGKLLLSKKEEAGHFSAVTENSFAATREKGIMIYNLQQRRYVNGPGFMRMLQLDASGKYYAVKTCSAHIGIMDYEGKLIADTIYSAFNYGDYRNPSEQDQYFYYTFYNDTSHFVFNAANGKEEKRDSAKAILLSCAINNVKKDNYIYTIEEQKNPALLLPDSNTIDSVLPWAKGVLFDSLFFPVRYLSDSLSHFRGNYCQYCGKDRFFPYNWSKDYERNSFIWKLDYSSDSCISAFRSPAGFHYYIDNPWRDFFFTTFLFSDGPHPVILDSLFQRTEWKNMIMQEVLTYINETKDVRGQCSNPFMFPVLLKNRFLIAKEGLKLYPPGYTIYERPVEILIPWEKLKPYLRADVASKIGI